MAIALAAALAFDTATHPAAARQHRYIAAALALTASVVYPVVGDVGPWWWWQVAALATGGMAISLFNLDLYHRSRLGWLIAALPGLTMVAAELIGGGPGSGPWGLYLLMASGLPLGLSLCLLRAEVHSPTDHGDHPISSARVDLARCLVVAVAILSWATETHGGFAGALEPIAPLWTVLWLVGLRELVSRWARGIGRKLS